MRSRTIHPVLQVSILVIALVVTLLPLVGLLLDSFKQQSEFYSGQILPREWRLTNYVATFVEGGAWREMVNSVVVAVVTTVITVALGSLAAYALARLRYGWVVPVIYAILTVRFYPKITTILPYYSLMRDLNLLDTLAAVVIAHVSIALPFVVLIMMTFFREIPRSLEEAALIDGCSIWQVFSRVVLPLVRPALMTSAILTAMFSWNEFLIAASVTSLQSSTLPVLVSSFMSDKGLQLGQLAAVSVVIVIPIALFILATQRYLVRGLTLGAVKE